MPKHVRYWILIALLLVSIYLPYQLNGHAQALSRAGLVVQYGDGSITTRCVEFSENSISGLELLQRSNIPFIAAYSAQGAAVCKIGNDGCPADDCFCQSPPDYWSYWHLQNGVWVYAGNGSGSAMLQNGAIDGWAWGAGDPPAQYSFDQVCAPAAPSATATATATATQPPTPTATATPTSLPAVSSSPTHTATPLTITPTLTPTLTPPTARLTPAATAREAQTTTPLLNLAATIQNSEVAIAQATAMAPQMILPPRRFSLRSTPPARATPLLSTSPTIDQSADIAAGPDISPTPTLSASLPPTTGITNYLVFGVLSAGLGLWLFTLLRKTSQ